MVRSLHYGPQFTESLKELSSKGFSTGLVLGSQLGDRAFAVCLVETPAEVPEKPEVPGTEAQQKRNVDVSWMLEHARQVYRLLPGMGRWGVRVIAFTRPTFQVESQFSAALSSTPRTCSLNRMGKFASWLEESPDWMNVSLTIRSSLSAAISPRPTRPNHPRSKMLI